MGTCTVMAFASPTRGVRASGGADARAVAPRCSRAAAAVALCAALVASAPARATAQHAQLPPTLVPLDSAEGERLLASAGARRDFFRLVAHLVTQQSQSYCGVASAVTVLAALQVPAPEAPAWSPHRAFTQDNFFNARARRVVAPESAARGGYTLAELAQSIEAHPARAEVVYADGASAEAFRRAAADALAEPGTYVIVNYLRSELGQDAVGHFSPLGAYNEAADRFLVLDVARYKYPPVWVAADALFRAMNTRDPVAGRSRGWLLVNAAPGAPTGPLPPQAGSRVVRLFALVGGALFALGVAVGALTTWLIARRRARRAR